MIVFKEKDLVYVAIPMGLHAYSNKSDVDYEYEDNWDAFFAGKDTNSIVAVDSASDRIIDILRYSDIFDGEITQRRLYEIREKVNALFENTNVDSDKKRYGIVVANKDKAYLMRSMGLCFEISGFEPVGESRQHCRAVYENVKNIENVEERVRKFYELMTHFRGKETFPIVIMNTGSNKGKIIY